MLKNAENNGTEEIGLVTPTPGPLFAMPYPKSVLQVQCSWSEYMINFQFMFTQGQMGVTETLRILLAIFLCTVWIKNVRLFGVYDVRWSFLAEVHAAPLKCLCLLVYRRVRPLRNAPASAAIIHLAGVVPVAILNAGI